MTRFPDIAGVVLAGGSSRRMGGVPKALCEVDGVAIVDRALAVLRTLFPEVIVVANDPAPYRGRPGVSNGIKGLPLGRRDPAVTVVPDIFPGCGPIGGIHAGLKAIARCTGFFTACDMPFIDAPLVARICQAAMAGDFTCAVPSSRLGLEPLHACYTKEALPVFEDAIRAGRLKIRGVIDRCRTVFVDLRGAEMTAMYNVNTPLDLATADRRGLAGAHLDLSWKHSR